MVATYKNPTRSSTSSFTLVRFRMLQRQCACRGNSSGGGECEECKKKQTALQRSSTGQTVPATVPPIVHDVLRSPGQPLDAATRAFFEPRFGHDFSKVRVRTDAGADESARAVNALAYSVEQDIAFGERQYAPRTREGRRLLAHELTHTVQQGCDAPPAASLRIEEPGSVVEREADEAAEKIGEGSPYSPKFSQGQTLARQTPAPAPAPGPGPTPTPGPATGPTTPGSKGDLVRYTGGSSGNLIIEQSGKEIFRTGAVSGNPGRQEYEREAGAIPTGHYTLHPAVTRPTVAKLQGGTCGADGIDSGYQELTSKDPSPCDDPPSHYCTVSCPTPAIPGRKCFTPVDCWGEKRMKIEGSIQRSHAGRGYGDTFWLLHPRWGPFCGGHQWMYQGF
jgi:Domain of unknown function (DUF4157)